jgi:predicted hydrocarbon binding protein
MDTEAAGLKGDEKEFWKGLPAMVDYFSPAIQPLLAYAGISSKRAMHDLGELVGGNAAAKLSHLTSRQMLDEFGRIWESNGIGKLTVVRGDPLLLQISDCTVCGQLQGTGEMYECAFHEGFFQGALSVKTGKPVTLTQETNYEGEAGTWCRRLSADTSV